MIFARVSFPERREGTLCEFEQCAVHTNSTQARINLGPIRLKIQSVLVAKFILVCDLRRGINAQCFLGGKYARTYNRRRRHEYCGARVGSIQRLIGAWLEDAVHRGFSLAWHSVDAGP